MGENPKHIVSRQAGSGVVNMRFVKEVGGGIVDGCSVAGEGVDGVACMRSIPINAAAAKQAITEGDDVAVAQDGDVIVEAGDVIADGAEIMVGAGIGYEGCAITFAAGGGKLAVGKLVNGSSSGAAGDKVVANLYRQAAHI